MTTAHHLDATAHRMVAGAQEPGDSLTLKVDLAPVEVYAFTAEKAACWNFRRRPTPR